MSISSVLFQELAEQAPAHEIKQATLQRKQRKQQQQKQQYKQQEMLLIP